MSAVLKERNARIMAAHKAGQTEEQIASDERLSQSRVSSIIRHELGLQWGERVGYTATPPVTNMERAMTSLRHGGSLVNCARLAGMTPAEFDLHLWSNLGAFVKAGRAA